MGAPNNIISFVLAMCLLLVIPNGKMVYVKAQYTNVLDVYGLTILVAQYPHLDEPVDDPCYPIKLSWIECTNDYPARVLALNLSSRRLTGQLPDFSYYMSNLETIDLHDNSLSGPIPAFFGNFYYLKKLDLSDNRFTGPIPSSLANNNNLVKDFSGNPGLASSSSPGSNTSPPSSGSNKSSSKLPIILGIVAAVVVISAVVGVFAIHKQRQRTAAVIQAANLAQINAATANI